MDPRTYWTYEVGHIAHVGPDEVGYMTPADLLGAGDLFDALYRVGG
jgi:hypothetical protein